ncbi:transposase [Enterococcus bulliens]
MSDHIKKMLRITDPSLKIINVSYETIKNRKIIIIEANFSPNQKSCPNCGCTAQNQFGNPSIVKNGKKCVRVRLDQYNHLPTIMKLFKQRYKCKECSSHWTAQSTLVEKRCSIGYHIKFKIIDLLKEKCSLTLIAKLCHVSITTVIRILKGLRTYIPDPKTSHLPTVLMVDEFRSYASIEDKMSFICADGKTGKLVDILPTRKLNRLMHYFMENPSRINVRYLVTNMNAAYDKLKANWRYLTKNRRLIEHTEYKTWRSFRAPKYPYLTEAMMIDRLLNYSPTLQEAYEYFHDISDALREKEPDLFFNLIKELPEHLDEAFRTKLQGLIRYEEGIRNAMIYPYSNGKIEAKNTHIKTLKRVSYGFKSFDNMRTRIFMMNQLIVIK